MMFDKDNTNFNGECLCKTCVYSAPIYLGTGSNRHKAVATYYCKKDIKECKNVGVCKDYEDFRADDNDNQEV